MRPNVIIGVLPGALRRAECWEIQLAGIEFITRFSMGAIGAFNGAVEFR
jgi:hypothetical protein